MQYVKLGMTGLNVSPIAIGAVSFGETHRGHRILLLGEEEILRWAFYEAPLEH